MLRGEKAHVSYRTLSVRCFYYDRVVVVLVRFSDGCGVPFGNRFAGISARLQTEVTVTNAWRTSNVCRSAKQMKTKFAPMGTHHKQN